MDNRNLRKAAQFLQSYNDFPLTVSLGRKTPDWGLTRWKGNSSLRFVPPDDEGFILRGDKQRLLYKGRKKSHRFTILGNGAFEYDCILLREPDSNIISLRMEGAENFDFFRQPDFVKEPFLKGSFAVYKKETLLGEGTGKLCHIHRPQIIDARGRKCWGELAVVGNELRITIPEKWLSEAKYPVVVDPTVGTTTVGSQTYGADPNNSSYNKPWLDGEFALNKYSVPQNGSGSCTAYVYAYSDETDSYIKPCLYTNVNNVPYQKKSMNENNVGVYVYPSFGYPAGWRNNTFQLNGNITAGDYIWFGFFASWFVTRFDYGGVCYKGWFLYDDDDDDGEPAPYVTMTQWVSYCTIKWSWYFTYTAVSSQNYVRTLTQGVSISDLRKLTANYKRTSQNTAGLTDIRFLIADYKRTTQVNADLTDIPGLTGNYKRQAYEDVNAGTEVKSFIGFLRKCVINVSNFTGIDRLPLFLRSVFDDVINETVIDKSTGLNRKCEDTAVNIDVLNKNQSFFKELLDVLNSEDDTNYSILFVRTLSNIQGVTDLIYRWGDYFRGLFIEAGNIAETVRWGNNYRFQNDTAQVEGFSFRHLLIFIKLVSTSFVRDFVLRRFLIAREQIILKSCVMRELTIESKIN